MKVELVSVHCDLEAYHARVQACNFQGPYLACKKFTPICHLDWIRACHQVGTLWCPMHCCWWRAAEILGIEINSADVIPIWTFQFLNLDGGSPENFYMFHNFGNHPRFWVNSSAMRTTCRPLQGWHQSLLQAERKRPGGTQYFVFMRHSLAASFSCIPYGLRLSGANFWLASEPL